MRAGDYDMALLALSDSTAMGLLEDFSQDSDRYSTGWQSEEYEALLEQAAAETGEQAVHTLARAEQLLLQSGVVLPLYTSMSHYAVSTEVQNAWIDPARGSSTSSTSQNHNQSSTYRQGGALFCPFGAGTVQSVV